MGVCWLSEYFMTCMGYDHELGLVRGPLGGWVKPEVDEGLGLGQMEAGRCHGWEGWAVDVPWVGMTVVG
jgi:hypothetical protein